MHFTVLYQLLSLELRDSVTAGVNDPEIHRLWCLTASRISLLWIANCAARCLVSPDCRTQLRCTDHVNDKRRPSNSYASSRADSYATSMPLKLSHLPLELSNRTTRYLVRSNFEQRSGLLKIRARSCCTSPAAAVATPRLAVKYAMREDTPGITVGQL